MIIKICGIKKPEDASFAISEGANWIGIIQHPNSSRYVDIDTAKQVASATHSAGGVAVGVFVGADAAQITEFCQITGVNHVQLHGTKSRQDSILLADQLVRIYVRHVQANGVCLEDHDARQAQLLATRDYLLFDSIHAGSGQSYAWNKLPVPANMRFFISGGLNSANIATAILHFKPSGVDVSSGVESAPGIKDQHLIAQFIAECRKVN